MTVKKRTHLPFFNTILLIEGNRITIRMTRRDISEEQVWLPVLHMCGSRYLPTNKKTTTDGEVLVESYHMPSVLNLPTVRMALVQPSDLESVITSSLMWWKRRHQLLFTLNQGTILYRSSNSFHRLHIGQGFLDQLCFNSDDCINFLFMIILD